MATVIFIVVFLAGFFIIASRDNGSTWEPGRNSLDVGLMLVGWMVLFLLLGVALSK